MTRVWLIRHAEPVVEAHHRCYGSLDVGLSEDGRAQVGEVWEFLRDEGIGVVYCSPRLRAIESATRRSRAGLETRPTVFQDLREIEFGDFEGLTYDEIAARYPDLYRQWMESPTEVRFPNGECFADMRARVLTAFDEIRREHENETIAIVSHGGVNRILIAWALQIPDDCLFRIAQDYAAVNLLEFVEGVPIVKLLNYSKRR
jgi:broad specificity phosphatase PhoE